MWVSLFNDTVDAQILQVNQPHSQHYWKVLQIRELPGSPSCNRASTAQIVFFLMCCRSPSKKFNFLLLARKHEGNPKS